MPGTGILLSPETLACIEFVNLINDCPEELDSVRKAVKVLRGINYAMRQNLIKIIHDNRRITVTEIYIKLRCEQSVASQHLGVLRKAGIVSTQCDGKNIHYELNYARLKEINELVGQM